MKREIKFRAWHTARKEMFRVGGIVWLPSGKINYLLNEEDRAMPAEEIKYWKLMQYTGLKDKNGTEIYEGDVVLVPDDYTEPISDDGRGPVDFSPHLSLVVFLDGCFKFRIFDDADMFHRGYFSYKDIEECVGVEELEIVGNIFENPELCKKQSLKTK